jgi:hypothetical protein
LIFLPGLAPVEGVLAVDLLRLMLAALSLAGRLASSSLSG